VPVRRVSHRTISSSHSCSSHLPRCMPKVDMSVQLFNPIEHNVNVVTFTLHYYIVDKDQPCHQRQSTQPWASWTMFAYCQFVRTILNSLLQSRLRT